MNRVIQKYQTEAALSILGLAAVSFYKFQQPKCDDRSKLVFWTKIEEQGLSMTIKPFSTFQNR
jgi:hypothetical protein